MEKSKTIIVYGDYYEAGATKNVTYHIERVEHFHEGGSGREPDGVFERFETLTREAIEKHPGDWKEILKPYKSAMDAGAMDKIYTREAFNAHFNVEVDASSFSRWTSGGYSYKVEENGAMIALFERLKNNPK